ncbi:hypothetical protein PTHTG4_00580 [Parageobacillus thermoglucosidasius]|nr:hypothetical protein PTHTG4_00580 [Parageobacillus thermoglucosidasius]
MISGNEHMCYNRTSCQETKGEISVKSSAANEVIALYQRLLDGWNDRNAAAMAEQFTEKGELIGFDGTQAIGREEIFAHLHPIFENHPTPPYVSKVKDVRFLASDIAILRAIAGMVPPGQSDVDPKLNAHHTLVAVKNEECWRIELFQNTPAQFHGRPELVEQMTEELRQLLK